MRKIGMKELLAAAERVNASLVAFNVDDMVSIQAVIAGAEAENAPVLVATTSGSLKFMGIEYAGAFARVAEATASVPVIFHLDHITDYALAVKAVAQRYGSLMIDGSKHPYEENVALTRQVVELGHAAGATVEGELGRLVGIEDEHSVNDYESALTDPDQAGKFVRETGLDTFAPAFGTAHGFYKGKPRLDFDRLEAIRKTTGLPLVLHGGTGIPDEDVLRCLDIGIRKANYGTELKDTYTRTIRTVSADMPKEFDPRKVLEPARKAMVEFVRDRIRLLRSAEIMMAL